MEIIKSTAIFLAGFLSCVSIIYLASSASIELPLSSSLIMLDKKAPADRITEDKIHILDDKIVIDIKGASLSRYAATGSMLPVLDEHSNGIRIVPKSPEEIKIGDIITYKAGPDLIVHRVIDKGKDEKGWYFVVKGDNNSFPDGKVRFKSIKYLTIGILW